MDDAEGTLGIGAYRVVDFGGGEGFFGETQPYPNGVADTSQSDFVVEATANAKFPAGAYSVAICSDDGRIQESGSVVLVDIADRTRSVAGCQGIIQSPVDAPPLSPQVGLN